MLTATHPSEDAYAAFMLDYAAGALSPGERLAVELHRRLSVKGAHNAGVWDTVGGAMLEKGRPASLARPDFAPVSAPPADRQPADAVSRILDLDLETLRWRKSLFGPKTAPAPGGLPMTEMLRLEPGARVPRHTHGRQDVSVILCGAFADDYAIYRRGDLAFSNPGVPHQPYAVGDEPCVCFVAHEPGKPLLGFFGMFGVMDRKRVA